MVGTWVRKALKGNRGARIRVEQTINHGPPDCGADACAVRRRAERPGHMLGRVVSEGPQTHLAAVLIEAWTELGLSVARAGVRKIVFVNSHGGNEEIMGIAARELRVRADMMAVKTSWQRFGRPAGMYPELEDRHGIHGGDVETSLMLHFRPDLVDMDAAQDFASEVGRAEQEFQLLRHTGTHAFAWIASDLNPHGVVGNAAAATAEKGRLTAEHQARGFVRLLEDVGAARLDDWLGR